jgi:hypothetical protein
MAEGSKMYLRGVSRADEGLGYTALPLGEPQPVAAPALPRVASFNFRSANGTVSEADNRCRHCPINLGVGIDRGAGPTASNGMELRFTLVGHRPGLEYDITRTKRSSLWQRVDGVWERLASVPMGAKDDRHDNDESLTPVNNHIYAIDTPGWRVVLPAADGMRLRLRNGCRTDTAATEIVRRLSLAEWVIVRDRGAGIPWTPLQLPAQPNGTPRRFVFWHSILWLRRNGANQWVLDAARSRIALGSLSAAVIDSAPVP